MAFRSLLILPYAYRCWAKLRLRHLSPWIQTWATEDTLALQAGIGADAALGLGAPRRRALFMPKGCPWSNALLGILMRPLLSQLRT